MKNILNLQSTIAYLGVFGLLMAFSSCERDLSDDAVFATFPATGDVFTDTPVGLTDEFFISFDPADGANPNGFGTDENEAFQGTTSIRIDVPAPNDPDGGFIGGIFRDRGDGRDLSGFDALTFYAKGSATGTIGTVGFGTDFEDGQFPVSASNIQLTTDWKKYVIPIPDPSKLTQEKGLFLFSAGGLDVVGDGPNGNEIGWTFWLDEIRFERLGTTRLLYPFILGGQDLSVDGFIGSNLEVNQLGAVYSLEDGQNISINVAPAYFEFSSSNNLLASVDDLGTVSIVGEEGTAIINGQLANTEALGSLTINGAGQFINAPDPARPSDSVISIFSDSYTGVTNLNVGAFNNENISIQQQTFDGNQSVTYENLGFVGMEWDGTLDVSGMTHLHLDVQRLDGNGSSLTVELIDFGPNNTSDGFGGTDDTAGGFNATSQLVDNEWVGIDIPLNGFTLATGGGGSGNPNLNNIGFFVLVSNGGTFLIDNVYFYSE